MEYNKRLATERRVKEAIETLDNVIYYTNLGTENDMKLIETRDILKRTITFNQLKMVLVPAAKLDAAIKQFEADGDYMMERELKEWIIDAPVAAIPLKEVPEECADCLAYYNAPSSCLALGRLVDGDRLPADCPIVTKE